MSDEETLVGLSLVGLHVGIACFANRHNQILQYIIGLFYSRSITCSCWCKAQRLPASIFTPTKIVHISIVLAAPTIMVIFQPSWQHKYEFRNVCLGSRHLTAHTASRVTLTCHYNFTLLMSSRC
jgi:hypothetical protein